MRYLIVFAVMFLLAGPCGAVLNSTTNTIGDFTYTNVQDTSTGTTYNFTTSHVGDFDYTTGSDSKGGTYYGTTSKVGDYQYNTFTEY